MRGRRHFHSDGDHWCSFPLLDVIGQASTVFSIVIYLYTLPYIPAPLNFVITRFQYDRRSVLEDGGQCFDLARRKVQIDFSRRFTTKGNYWECNATTSGDVADESCSGYDEFGFATRHVGLFHVLFSRAHLRSGQGHNWHVRGRSSTSRCRVRNNDGTYPYSLGTDQSQR